MTALAPLRVAPFRRLLAARTTTYLGNAVAPVALAFAVLDLTGSAASLGLVVGARSLVLVLVLLAGGVLADRLPRSVVLTGSELLAALTQAAVAALVLTGSATVGLLVGLSAVNGAAAAVSLPAASALLPQTVPADLLTRANALARLGSSTALVTGAAAGGAVVALVGPGWGLALDAASFAVAAALFAGVRVPHGATGPDPAGSAVLTALRQGWTEVRSRTWVWAVVAQFAVVNAVLAGGLGVLGPVVADATFGRAGWGVVLGAQSLGFVLGGVVALAALPRHALRWGVALTGVVALPLLVLGTAPHLVLVAASALAAGCAVEVFAVGWDVSLQQDVPADRLARVYSYDSLGSFVAIPLAEVVVGPVAAVAGTRAALLGCAGLVLLATALALTSHQVRSLERDPTGTPPDTGDGPAPAPEPHHRSGSGTR